ncbi:DUF5333 domain-containing protein [Sagittula sp. SSi028]|uniref:DUF5333 domain-containing protein n=1 Tax=Sagittula sp. SSi028 TaxID=3400636 RepID=UPI003AF8616B
MRLIPLVSLCVALAAPAMAKPHLSEVKEIDDRLMQIAIADELRKTCDDIDARMIRGLGQLNELRSQAKSMGYSNDEIEDYVTSKSEKKRMRQRAEAWLSGQGVNSKNNDSFCAFGRQQISKGTYIGSLLR